MLWFSTAVEAYACAPGYVLYNRQQATELGRYGDGDMVAECGYLIPHALDRIAEPAVVDDEATRDGRALGLIAD